MTIFPYGTARVWSGVNLSDVKQCLQIEDDGTDVLNLKDNPWNAKGVLSDLSPEEMESVKLNGIGDVITGGSSKEYDNETCKIWRPIYRELGNTAMVEGICTQYANSEVIDECTADESY